MIATINANVAAMATKPKARGKRVTVRLLPDQISAIMSLLVREAHGPLGNPQFQADCKICEAATIMDRCQNRWARKVKP